MVKDKREYMTSEKVSKLVSTLAVPAVITMLITTLYNMADTFFVGRIGDGVVAASAVSVVFAFMAIMQAVGFFFGHGSGNYVSRALGANERGKAEVMASVGFFSAFILGALFTLFGLVFIEPFAYLLQANAENVSQVKAYLFYILFGAPFITSSFTLNNQLRFQGSAFFGMIGMTTGGLLNIALDPLFIFVFKMGIAGAGLATSLSQFISFCILLFMGRKKDNIRIRFSRFRPSLRLYVEIFKGGLPSLVRQGLSSVSFMCVNAVAYAVSGNDLVSAMGVTQKIINFFASALIGFGQGFQPVCGYNWGAKKYGRVKQAFWFCMKVSLVFGLTVSLFGFIFSEQIAMLINSAPAVYKLAGVALKFWFSTFTFFSLMTVPSMMMQTLSRAVSATSLSLISRGLVMIPTLYALKGFGANGVYLAQPVSDVVSFLVAVPLTVRLLKEISRLEREQKEIERISQLSPASEETT